MAGRSKMPPEVLQLVLEYQELLLDFSGHGNLF
jgi:hypothetical protein